ncbi:MAG: transposase, partial [Clostridia bacterium]
MLKRQTRMLLSPYLSIYDKIIPKDNVLRQMKELVDFSFIHEELQSKYCLDNGRNAIDPVILFKYLLLKAIFKLSDRDVVERSRYDMSFKYFLDLEPEAEVIDASTLTKFRKLRLKDSNLLDLLIGKTVEIALDKGIIKSKAIIVDSTHTRARYHLKSPGEVL